MLETARYTEQASRWPQQGRHILAQFDDQSVLVYQAYRPAIAHYALQHGVFGGEYSYSRMSWIKPNFLWMMYRSGWGTKEGQEATLALRVRRAFFEELLAQAVESSYSEVHYPTREAWQKAVAASTVRVQWDPDHHPSGAPVERRALQLGLRGAALEAFGKRELLEVIDMSPFVLEQRGRCTADRLAELVTPTEQVYEPLDRTVWNRLGLASGST